jgi:hypothetical protein
MLLLDPPMVNRGQALKALRLYRLYLARLVTSASSSAQVAAARTVRIR